MIPYNTAKRAGYDITSMLDELRSKYLLAENKAPYD
jgi:hypothetical protein